MNAIQNNEKLARHVDDRPLQESHLAFRKARHLKEIKIIPTCQVNKWGCLMNAIQNNEKLARHVDNRPLIRILYRPTQNFVRQRCNVSLPR